MSNYYNFFKSVWFAVFLIAIGSVICFLQNSTSSAVVDDFALVRNVALGVEAKKLPLVEESEVNIDSTNSWKPGGSYQYKSVPGYVVYGSYVGGDQNTGKITLNGEKGQILLYETGASSEGQYMAIVSVEGEVLKRIQLPLSTTWSGLLLKGKGIPSKFRVVMMDEGKGWGQWSAVSLPKTEHSFDDFPLMRYVMLSDAKKNMPLIGDSVINNDLTHSWELGGSYRNEHVPGYVVYGSYVGGDQNTGKITLDGEKGQTLLYKTGPSAKGQYIEIVSTVGKVLKKVQLPLSRTWSGLTLEGKEIPSKFRVVMIDEGKGWGQWSAVSLPSVGRVEHYDGFDILSGFNWVEASKKMSLISKSGINNDLTHSWELGGSYQNEHVPGYVVYGSYVGGDQNTGKITLDGEKGQTLLYKTGPSAEGQYIEIVSTEGKVLKKFQLPLSTIWNGVMLNGKDTPNKFRVVMMDEGKGWGQWSSVMLLNK